MIAEARTRLRVRLAADAGWALLGRGATACFVVGIGAVSGTSAKSDTLVTVISQGGVIPLFFLQLSVLVVTPTVRQSGDLVAIRRRQLLKLAFVVAALMAVSVRPIMQALAVPLSGQTVIAWLLLAALAPIGVALGVAVARAHAKQVIGLRFAVPLGSPLLALVTWVVFEDLLLVVISWCLGWALDLMLMSLATRNRPRADASDPEGVSRPGSAPVAAALAMSLVGITASAVQMAVLNRIGDGATTAYYTADRVVLGAVALVNALVIPRILAGHTWRSGRFPFSWHLLGVLLPMTIAVLVSLRLPWTSNGLGLTALMCGVLLLGWPAIALQQMMQARLVAIERSWASVCVALTSAVINVGGSMLALSTGNIGAIPVAVVCSAGAASVIGRLIMRGR